MGRSEHVLVVKTGRRRIARVQLSVDVKDQKDLTDAIKEILDDHHQKEADNVTADIYKPSGDYVKTVDL